MRVLVTTTNLTLVFKMGLVACLISLYRDVAKQLSEAAALLYESKLLEGVSTFITAKVQD